MKKHMRNTEGRKITIKAEMCLNKDRNDNERNNAEDRAVCSGNQSTGALGSCGPDNADLKGNQNGDIDSSDSAAVEYAIPMYSIGGTFNFEGGVQPLPLKVPKNRPVRIYCDGVYDLFHYGHARQLKQAKQLFSNVYLLVGVTNDESTLEYKGSTVMSEVERYESVKHCKYVDEVVEDAPWVITPEFIEKHKIDYVAHDDIPYASVDQDDIYLELKKKEKFIPTRRTANISTSSLITRLLRDYDKYLRRQILRGISKEDLNISSFKESQVRIKEKLNAEFDGLKNDISEVLKRWEKQSNIWLKNFIGKFETTKPGWIEKLVKFVKKRRIGEEQA